jgi:hypothetical protein
MSKTKIEIIDETVAYYSEDVSRRSISKGEYRYFGDNGKKCAYARCWKDNAIGFRENTTARSENMPEPDDLVRDEYKGYNRDFWQDIQSIHDANRYWDEKGMTEIGRAKVENLKRLYSIELNPNN